MREPATQVTCKTCGVQPLVDAYLEISSIGSYISRGRCGKCGGERTVLGYHKPPPAKRIALRRNRPDALPKKQNKAFIQGGCLHCGGDIIPDPYYGDELHCLQCARPYQKATSAIPARNFTKWD